MKDSKIDAIRWAADISKRNSEPGFGIQSLLDGCPDVLRKYPRLTAIGSALRNSSLSHDMKVGIVFETINDIARMLPDTTPDFIANTYFCAYRCVKSGHYYQAFDDITVLASYLPDDPVK